MFKVLSFILLMMVMNISVVAETANKVLNKNNEFEQAKEPWPCYTAEDAAARKKRLTKDFLPYLVFEGSTKAKSVEARMRSSLTPALSVAVIDNGKLDWTEAWGHLQAGGDSVDCASLFQAGSLAKPVTLMAGLRIKSAGLIDFDQNIETYLLSYRLPPGKQSEAKPVTLRNLLSHTAGIVRGGYAGYTQGEPLPTDIQIVNGEAPSNSRKVEVVSEPGALLAYSGGGYTLVEIALQDKLQAPFERIMHDWLLAPAGMKQADFTIPLPVSSHPYTARGHQIDGKAIKGGWNNYPEQAAAGLWATATDLAMFLLEIHKAYQGNSKLFSQSSIQELLASPIANHAYGFRLISGDDNQVFITHYGGTIGYRAGVTINLNTGDGAVFLTNSDNGASLGEEFFSAVSRSYQWPVFREKVVKRVKKSDEALESLAGNYVFSPQDWVVSVVKQTDSLKFVFPAGNRQSLTMYPIEGRVNEFAHETGVIANFTGEGKHKKIYLFGQTGQRQLNLE